MLMPFAGLLVAYDAWWRHPGPTAGHVLGIGGATQTLAQMTVRRHSRLTRTACEQQLDVTRLVANGVDRTARDEPRHTVPPPRHRDVVTPPRE